MEPKLSNNTTDYFGIGVSGYIPFYGSSSGIGIGFFDYLRPKQTGKCKNCAAPKQSFRCEYCGVAE